MQPSMAAPSHFTVDDDVRDAELGANDAAVQPPSFDPLLFADARWVWCCRIILRPSTSLLRAVYLTILTSYTLTLQECFGVFTEPLG